MLGLQFSLNDRKELVIKGDPIANIIRGHVESEEVWENCFSGKYHCESMVACLRSLSDEDLKSLNLQSADRDSLTSLVKRLKVRNTSF
jgi:hypothetical protein